MPCIDGFCSGSVRLISFMKKSSNLCVMSVFRDAEKKKKDAASLQLVLGPEKLAENVVDSCKTLKKKNKT